MPASSWKRRCRWSPSWSIALPDRHRFSPLYRPARRRLISVVAQWTYALASLQPLVLLIEDLQGRSLHARALSVVGGGMRQAPLMLIYTARPNYGALADAHHHSHLLLILWTPYRWRGWRWRAPR
jgi:hypothetical protein